MTEEDLFISGITVCPQNAKACYIIMYESD